MMSTRKTYRLGTTAIAAVLALSATQLAAQEAPATDAPVVETPTVAIAPPTTEPAATVDPLAPVAEPEATMPAETVIRSVEPIENAPSAKAVVKKFASKSTSSAQSPTAKASAPAAAPAPAAPSEVAAAPVPSPAPIAAPAPTAEAAPVAQASASDKPKIDEAVPLAGGAGAVILALAGAGMAVRRRKRREEEEELEQTWSEEPAMVEAEVAPEPKPSWDPPVVQPKPASMATTEIPEDFDTSTFGRHVEAAYAGPTPENPSLSLRKRLKIAGELDRRERVHGNVPKPTSFKPVANAPQSMNFMFSGPSTKEKSPEPQF